MHSRSEPNVIIFGETGAGKSSVINMFPGKPIATVGSGADGCTFENRCYKRQINNMTFNVYDTVGFNAQATKNVTPKEAIANLGRLIREVKGGVNLLVYVTRGRPTPTAQRNYEVFYKILCNKNVPIVIVVTGLELADRNAWWDQNENLFSSRGMIFKDAACVTAIPGIGGIYMAEYKESKKNLKDLVLGSYLEDGQTANLNLKSRLVAVYSFLTKIVSLLGLATMEATLWS